MDDVLHKSLGTGSQRLRPLGTFEHFRVVLHNLAFHCNVSIIARYSGAIISHQALSRALVVAIDEHPALSVIVTAEGETAMFFQRVQSFDIGKMIHVIDCPPDVDLMTGRFDEILSEQNSRGFVSDGLPLWRVLLFEPNKNELHPGTDIAFVWHHVIGDGKSGLAVLSTILRALNSMDLQSISEARLPLHSLNIGVESSSSPIVAPPEKALYPALEEIFPLPLSLRAKFCLALPSWIGRFLAVWKNKDTGKWSGSFYHCEEPIKTRIRHISIPPASVQKLVSCCRAEGTSITPLLQTIVGRTLCEVFSSAQRLRCATAISLRRFFDPELHIDDRAMGLWVSAFHLEYTRSQLMSQKLGGSSFWKEARRNTKRIRLEISRKDTDLGIGMLRFIPNFRSSLLSKMGTKRQDSYAITNLGLFEEDTEEKEDLPGRVRISNLVFSQSCHVNGSALQFCVVSVKGGEMSIAISWQEGTVSAADVEDVAATLRNNLLRL